VAALFFNADQLLERYNMPDTLKGQYTAYLTAGYALHSDMGHILCSLTQDTCGWHDTLTGVLDAEGTSRKWGAGTYQALRNDFHRNSLDNFLIELGKWGLGKRDLHANVNFFTKVVVEAEGALAFIPGHCEAGARVELRADMNVLCVLSNTPHPLDPSPAYAPAAVKLGLRRAAPRTAEDPVALRRPENARAFALTDALFD
jgi:urea carboxylase-associated protein 2